MYPDATHVWYADNAGTLGMYVNIDLYFNSLKHLGLGCGYPEPSKRVLIVHPDNLKTRNSFYYIKGLRFSLARVILAVYWGQRIQT